MGLSVRRRVAAAITLLVGAGGLLAVPAWSAPTWLPPVTDVSGTGTNVTGVHVAVDPAGNATAVWSRLDNTTFSYFVQASVRPAGGAWGPIEDLSGFHVDTSRDPQVAVDAAGTATVVWTRLDGSDYIVQTRSRSLGGPWSETKDLTDIGQSAFDVQVAVGAAGDTVAIWRRSDGLNALAEARVRPAGSGTWGPVDVLSVTGQDAIAPQIAVDPAGNAVAVWGRFGVTNDQVQAAYRPAGGTWSPAEYVSEDGEDAYNPAVAVDAAGNVTAIWERYDGTNERVQVAQRPPGGPWGPADDVSTPGEDATDPRVAVNAVGNAVAAWVNSGSANILQARYRSAGGAWGPVDDLSAQNAGGAHVALDAAGNATAVWSSNVSGHPVVQSRYRPAGGDWAPVADLAASGGDAAGPDVGMDAAGNTTAVWLRSVGGPNVAQARVLDAAAPVVTGFAGPATGQTGQALAYTASGTDTWSGPVGVSWSFGDGGTGTGSNASHTYAAAGSYTVTATLTDTVGNASVRSLTTTITAAPAPPPAAQPPRLTTFRFKPAKISAHGLTAGVSQRTRAKLVLTAAAKVKLIFKKKGSAKRVAKLVRHLPAGTSRIKLTAKIGKVRLKPGTYVVKAVATSADGRSPVKKATLKVVR